MWCCSLPTRIRSSATGRPYPTACCKNPCRPNSCSRPSGTGEQALASGAAHRLEPRMGIELVQHAVYVIADRMDAEVQAGGDLFGRGTRAEFVQHFALALREDLAAADLSRTEIQREFLEPLRGHRELP